MPYIGDYTDTIGNTTTGAFWIITSVTINDMAKSLSFFVAAFASEAAFKAKASPLLGSEKLYIINSSTIYDAIGDIANLGGATFYYVYMYDLTGLAIKQVILGSIINNLELYLTGVSNGSFIDFLHIANATFDYGTAIGYGPGNIAITFTDDVQNLVFNLSRLKIYINSVLCNLVFEGTFLHPPLFGDTSQTLYFQTDVPININDVVTCENTTSFGVGILDSIGRSVNKFSLVTLTNIVGSSTRFNNSNNSSLIMFFY